MILFFLAYIAACFYGIKIQKNLNSDYLSVENTQAIKGLFILLVFFSHFNSYVTFAWSLDSIYQSAVSWFGQTMVTLFLFYSGYGVMESINKKGLPYIKSIPIKRILSTLFKFDCAVIIFWIIGALFGNTFSPKTVALSLIGWDSLGNSNWYIFVVLLLYLFTFVSFRFLSQKNRIIPLVTLLLLIIGCISASVVFSIKPIFWVDTMLCYVMGMGYSQYRKFFEGIINKSNLVYCVVTLACVSLFVIIKQFGSDILFTFPLNLLFAICVVLLTMRITLKNKILLWCGKHLFEIYILQRIPMIIFDKLGLPEVSIYLYFTLCLITTVIIVFPFKYVTDKLWKLILKGFQSFKKQKSLK